MRALFLFTTLSLLLALAAPADALAEKSKGKEAAKPKPPAAAKELARPVFDPEGRFSFCLLDHPNAEGRKITIAQSPAKQINLGFMIPKAGFEVGAKYDLKVSVGSENPRKIRAQAIDGETILLQMGAGASFRKKLQSAQTIQLGTSERTVDFSLPPMEGSLASLDRCLIANQGKVDEKKQASSKSADTMPEALKALLATAGLTNIAPMDMSHIPAEQRPADYIWKSGNLLGGIRGRRAPEGATLSDLVGLHMTGLKSRCGGTFKADLDREKKASGLTLQTALARCAGGDGEGKGVAVAILFYLTERGNFTSFSHEAKAEQSAEALAARDKLAKTILSIAEKER